MYLFWWIESDETVTVLFKAVYTRCSLRSRRNHLIHASPLTRFSSREMDNAIDVITIEIILNWALMLLLEHLTTWPGCTDTSSNLFFFFIPWRCNQCHIVSYVYCPSVVLYCDSLEVYSALCFCRITWCYQSQWCGTVFPAPLHSECHQRRKPGTHQARAFHHLQGETEILAARIILNTPDSSVYQHHGYICNNILTERTGCHHSQHHKCNQYNLKLIN